MSPPLPECPFKLLPSQENSASERVLNLGSCHEGPEGPASAVSLSSELGLLVDPVQAALGQLH